MTDQLVRDCLDRVGVISVATTRFAARNERFEHGQTEQVLLCGS
jgi:hypothetical protein